MAYPATGFNRYGSGPPGAALNNLDRPGWLPLLAVAAIFAAYFAYAVVSSALPVPSTPTPAVTTVPGSGTLGSRPAPTRRDVAPSTWQRDYRPPTTRRATQPPVRATEPRTTPSGTPGHTPSPTAVLSPTVSPVEPTPELSEPPTPGPDLTQSSAPGVDLPRNLEPSRSVDNAEEGT